MSVIACITTIVISLLFSSGIYPDKFSDGTEQFFGVVTAVTDGDTVKVLTPALREVTIRLYGIDAPEKN